MNGFERVETKEKILQAAEELFAEFGYGGASIREIASRSGANVAAVNYHFKSKDNLYWHVMDRSHQILEGGVAEAAASAEVIEDLVSATLEFLLHNGRSLKNAMKMMLSSGVNAPEENEMHLACLGKPGPPGYQYFVPLVQKEMPAGVEEAVIDFGVRSIFAGVMWWGILCSSAKFENFQKVDPCLDPDYIRAHVRTHARAIIESLKTRHREIAASLPKKT